MPSVLQIDKILVKLLKFISSVAPCHIWGFCMVGVREQTIKGLLSASESPDVFASINQTWSKQLPTVSDHHQRELPKGKTNQLN